jgi:hypothetical protein
MLLLKLTALASVVSLVLSLVVELYFGFVSKPYLFGFPHRKWSLLIVLAAIYAVSLKVAYYVVFEKLRFYGS